MSDYEKLQQLVKVVSGNTQQNAYALANGADHIEELSVLFISLTEATRDPSAKAVTASFFSAQKQMLIAAKALLEAAKAGYAWCGDAPVELNLVLKRKR